jgi:antitoxin (DNA-binding transcriptional repressor) of toxin-antitoxin stability system
MNMRETTFTELRAQAKHFFDLVESGEIVRVLRNGKPIADIHPIPHELPSWKRRPAQPLVVGGATVSRMIIKDRGD